MHTLKAEHVHKTYSPSGVITQVLRGVSYCFEPAQSYAISGVSGSGKSTLLHILAGIDDPTSGRVLYDGTDIRMLSQTQRAHFLHGAIGLVFQDPHLIKELTVIENVMLKDFIVGTMTSDSICKAQELLDLIGLIDKAHHHPLSLSGGQQQRVAVLRALFNKPHFLLADEPTGNLDAETAQMVISLLLQSVEWGMGLIVCSHDHAVAHALSKQLALERGVLVEYN